MRKLQRVNASQVPMFPTKSSWKIPRELPNLAGASSIGLDSETRDPQLLEKGPGVRRDGYMVGLSVAVPEGKAWYLPFGHSTGEQFDKDKVMLWAKDNLCNENQPKVGANLLYDLDYFQEMGVDVKGPFHDVQVAQPLINENAKKYSLDTLARLHLGERKREDLLSQACKDYGFKGKPQKHIWRLDPKYTGYYAEGDAIQALDIFEKQKVILKEQGLEEIFDIETRLIPMLLHMRKTGVKIDEDRLMTLHSHKEAELKEYVKNLDKIAGQPINYNAGDSIALVYDKLGMPYPRTPKTNKPSFVKGWLEAQNTDIAKMIVKCREDHKFIKTFLEGSLLNMMVGDNRIHCQFNQLKGDDYGTVTGRLSSSNPNLQFIPIRTAEGKRIRKCFIPDESYDWYKADYSQIEIRILAHYAMGIGSKEIVEQFIKFPKTDYHQWCADKAGVNRDDAKCINFGIVYGMGAAKLAVELGITFKAAKKFLKEYFQMLPFIPKTVGAATDAAAERGYIKTIMGRRRRFDLWEPRDTRLTQFVGVGPDRDKIDYKVQQYKNAKAPENNKFYRMGTQRAGCYKAFNAADQGSAADIMKKALVDVWESGVCSVIKPYITVHDELDFGSPKTKEGREAAFEVKRIMEDTYKLKVPMVVDLEKGPNWGNIKEAA